MKAKAKKKRAYDSTLRREQAEQTRARIVECATEILKSGVRPEHLSYADVAERTGIAARTVYRHFPELEGLLREVALGTIAESTEGGELSPDVSGAVEQLARLHRNLSADPSLYRVLLAAPVRSQSNYGEMIERWFASVLEHVPEPQRRATAAVIELLVSPYAWEVMHTHYHLSPETITRTCLAAIQAIADCFPKNPRELDPASPLPPLFRPKTAPKRRAKKE